MDTELLIVGSIPAVIVLSVLAWFSRKARVKGRSGLIWALVGGTSYFLPVSFLSAAFADDLRDNLLLWVAIFFIGVVICFLAGWVLKRRVSTNESEKFAGWGVVTLDVITTILVISTAYLFLVRGYASNLVIFLYAVVLPALGCIYVFRWARIRQRAKQVSH